MTEQLTQKQAPGLVGKNYYGYGEVIAENFLHPPENFAGDTAPFQAGAKWNRRTDLV